MSSPTELFGDDLITNEDEISSFQNESLIFIKRFTQDFTEQHNL